MPIVAAHGSNRLTTTCSPFQLYDINIWSINTVCYLLLLMKYTDTSWWYPKRYILDVHYIIRTDVNMHVRELGDSLRLDLDNRGRYQYQIQVNIMLSIMFQLKTLKPRTRTM